jgi:hypothetical protein
VSSSDTFADSTSFLKAIMTKISKMVYVASAAAITLLTTPVSLASPNSPSSLERNVGRELLYCGNLYRGLALSMPAEKQAAMNEVGEGWTKRAGELLADDANSLFAEQKKVADKSRRILLAFRQSAASNSSRAASGSWAMVSIVHCRGNNDW